MNPQEFALLVIASEVLQGEMNAVDGDYDDAIAHLDRAVRLQDSLVYNEPPSWHYPIRHTLGSVLLAAGRAQEAEVVYWQDLAKNRENGFALYGLVQTFETTGQQARAAEARKRFETAWKASDVKLTSSRY